MSWVRILAIDIMLLSAVYANADKLLQKLYPRQVLEKTIVKPGKYKPVPTASSAFWKENVGYWMRNSYANNGKGYLGKSWTAIPGNIFSEYSRTGNRTNYEGLSFALRRQMACMVMAECMQDSGVFINDIIKGLYYFVKETWWGIPAHYPKAQPDANLQEVDLFNAETANLLAWTCYMLEDRIRRRDRNICNTIRNEIRRRILIPARTTDYAWKRYSWNHNSWTCANWLACILFCETDRQQQIADICQVLKCLDIFIDGYPDDGACDEGVTYWDRAMGSLFESMQLLDLASDGHITLPKTDKIKAMASYIYKMYIANEYYVNFADSQSKNLPNINILYPLGVALDDQAMCQHAAFIAKEHEYMARPWMLFNQTGNFPTVSRELCFLRLLKNFEREQPKEAVIPCSWLADSEIFTARNSNGIFVAAKGGHNDESHNHNDVGNFIVYANGQPLLIDLGNDTYSAKTFGKDRYTLTHTRSAYHNVPLINGQEQQHGHNFRSRLATLTERDDEKIFTIDITKAYPATAHLNSWHRQFHISSHGVTVIENYSLASINIPIQLVLMTPNKPCLTGGGRILLGATGHQYELSYPADQMKVNIEPVDISGTALQTAWQTPQVYRVLLTILTPKLNGTVRYTIQTL